jgi:hypothetical protein
VTRRKLLLGALPPRPAAVCPAVDFPALSPLLCIIGLGAVPGRRLAPGGPGAFRFSGEDPHPRAGRCPVRAPAQLAFDDSPRPVRLTRIENWYDFKSGHPTLDAAMEGATDRPCHEILDLG